jgi:hypothetical protein
MYQRQLDLDLLDFDADYWYAASLMLHKTKAEG